MERRRPRRWAIAGGVLVGALVAAGIVASWDPAPEVVRGPEAERAFLDAWERSRTATYYVASDFHRTTVRGGELDTQHVVAQRPPDVVRRQSGDLSGRIGDRRISCDDPTESGQVRCLRGSGDLPPYDEEVADELAQWEEFFAAPTPLYRVQTTGDGCFDLSLAMLYPAPPYGRWARFCFDDATGAAVYVEIRRDEGTDVLQAVEVRAQVSDADFALPR